MNGSSNPYQAPRALFTADEKAAMPPAMLVTMVCYLAHHALEIIPLYVTPIAKFEIFTPTVIVLGIYGVAMCVALWRRQQWARVWLVLTTVLAVFLLGRLLWRLDRAVACRRGRDPADRRRTVAVSALSPSLVRTSLHVGPVAMWPRQVRWIPGVVCLVTRPRLGFDNSRAKR